MEKVYFIESSDVLFLNVYYIITDLMLPGVIPDNRPSPKMFGKLQKGELVTINVAGNK